jgi:hypothetical protein
LVLDIRRVTSDFTKNGPTFFVVGPGEAKTIPLNVSDGWWEFGGHSDWKEKPVAVSVILHIEDSKEAKQFGVWTGTVISQWTDQVGR